MEAIGEGGVDVVVKATGDPAAGIAHARAAHIAANGPAGASSGWYPADPADPDNR